MINNSAFLYLLIWFGTCLPLCIGAIGSSHADTSDPSAPPPEAWNISADRINYDQKQNLYTAAGNVAITRQGRTLTADHVSLNQKTREAFAQGNVRLESGKDVLTGDGLQIHLDHETGTLTNGTVFISENHLYLSGQKIIKTGLQSYKAKNIRLTSCDGPDPDWEITGRDLSVTVEGYGFAKHTALWAGSLPVLYSPYLVFPVKLKRQSGLLTPEFGYSDRKGGHYLQPLYWAINDHSDATLYAHYMSLRGMRTGLEYRYVMDKDTLGTTMAEGFQDYRFDDGQGDNTKRWGYANDDPLRINKDRYWIRMKHNQGFDSGLTAKLDIDVVSDQDYLHEFRSGYNGFDKTRNYYRSTFGRDIEDFNEPVRLNRLNLNRTWHHYSLNTDLRWYDDVVKRRYDDKHLPFYDDAIQPSISQPDNTLHQLPVISFNGVKHPLGSSPLYFDLTNSYSHFYRIKGTRGHRADIYPRIYYPITLWQTLSVEPSLGVRQTAWQIDHYDTEPKHERRTLYRAIYDAKLELSTEIFRVFDFTIAGSDRLKHTVTPEIIYEFTPDEDQTDFPKFDKLDRIEPKNLITYGVTNSFTSRTPNISKDPPAAYTYTPFLRFKLSQSFDITKERKADPEPFSAISAELDLKPGRYVVLDFDTKWSPYDSHFESFNSLLKLWDLRGDHLSIDYRYTRDTENTEDGIESIRLTSGIALGNRWRLRAGYEFNLHDDTEIESSAGVGYKSQCWVLDFDYVSEKDNNSFTMMVNLIGLGSVGVGS